jgi:hypothetical protein
MEDKRKIKRIKSIEFVSAHLVKPGDCFRKNFTYLGTIVARVRFKLKHSGLAKNEYHLPIEILSVTKEDGYYYKGQLTNLTMKPRKGKFSKLELVEIKYHKKI